MHGCRFVGKSRIYVNMHMCIELGGQVTYIYIPFE